MDITLTVFNQSNHYW